MRRTIAQRRRLAQHPAGELVSSVVIGRRMREAQQVARRPLVTTLILHGLIGELIERLIIEPRGDRAAQTATPTTELLDVGCELQQVGCRAADLMQTIRQRETARVIITPACTHGESEDRGVLLGARPAIEMSMMRRTTAAPSALTIDARC